MHKRWKRPPTRHVLIISDGKPGHVKQSLTVTRALKERYGDVREQAIEIRYRNRVARALCLHPATPAAEHSVFRKGETLELDAEYGPTAAATTLTACAPPRPRCARPRRCWVRRAPARHRR